MHPSRRTYIFTKNLHAHAWTSDARYFVAGTLTLKQSSTLCLKKTTLTLNPCPLPCQNPKYATA